MVLQTDVPRKKWYANHRDSNPGYDARHILPELFNNASIALRPKTKDVQDINFDATARLAEHYVFKFYQPAVKFLENFTPFWPRKASFWQTLRLLDLDSDRYISPFIDETDDIIATDLAPFLTSYNADHKEDDPDNNVIGYKTKLQELKESLNHTRQKLLDTKIPIDGPSERSLKAVRLKSMLQYLDLIEEKAESLTSQESSAQKKNDAFARLVEFRNQQTMRATGVKLVQENGRWVERPAVTEDIRRLKRCFDAHYINPHVRKLPFFEVEHTLDNAENYFIKSATSGFKENGEPIPQSEKQVEMVKNFAQHIANLYRSGREHDALWAVQLYKWREGRTSEEIIPSGFREALREEMRGDFRNAKMDIDEDDHFGYFDNKLRNIVNGRDHSPLADGPRDAQDTIIKFVFPYIAGRRYPGGSKENTSFIATPYAADFFQKPVLGLQQKFKAHFMGHIVDVKTLNRKPRGPAEKENGTALVINKFLWRSKAQPGEDGKAPPYNSFLDRAPIWFKLPARIVTLPVFVPYKIAWGNKWGKRITTTAGVIGATTALAVFTPIPALALTGIGMGVSAMASTTIGAGILAAGGLGIGAAAASAGTAIFKSTKNTIKAFKKGDHYKCQRGKDEDGSFYTLREYMKLDDNGQVRELENVDAFINPLSSTTPANSKKFSVVFKSNHQWNGNSSNRTANPSASDAFSTSTNAIITSQKDNGTEDPGDDTSPDDTPTLEI